MKRQSQPMGPPLGPRTMKIVHALAEGPADVYLLKERTGLIRNEIQKVCSRGALMGLFTRDKTFIPQRWSIRPDWQEAIDKKLLKKLPRSQPRNAEPSERYEGTKSRRRDRSGPLRLQSVWGSVVGQSLGQ